MHVLPYPVQYLYDSHTQAPDTHIGTQYDVGLMIAASHRVI